MSGHKCIDGYYRDGRAIHCAKCRTRGVTHDQLTDNGPQDVKWLRNIPESHALATAVAARIHQAEIDAARTAARQNSDDLARVYEGYTRRQIQRGLDDAIALFTKPRLRLYSDPFGQPPFCVLLVGSGKRTVWYGVELDAMRAAFRGEFTRRA